MMFMPRHARVVHWNGTDVPPELRELPAGRYIVEALEDDAALESYRQGGVVDAKRAREIIDAAFGR